jgi:Deacetylases, including yeast histone deacetylase and acetoin utilization protein
MHIRAMAPAMRLVMTQMRIFDAYNPYVFPNDPLGAAGVDYKMPVAPGTEGDAYLAALEKGLAEAFDAFVPDVVFYLAGSDVLQDDPLGGLKLTPADIIARDSLVVEHVRALNRPLVIVLAGGYLPNNGAIIARSLYTLWPALDGTPLQ